MNDIKKTLGNYADWFNAKLPSLFPLPQGAEKRVVEAMLYSVANGGKRLRPFLVAETASLFGVDKEKSFMTAAALECLHSYSLIHDDLPAMDNDELRRGKPTCHKQFDEATAILAGDGLLTYAFGLLTSPQTSASSEIRTQLVSLLADAAGAFGGMVAGQMLDLDNELNGCKNEQETINRIEEMKTGRLIRYACEAGAVLGNAPQQLRAALVSYSRRIGAAFQIADDILDVEGNPELVGKTLNKDAAQGKLTFIRLFGLEESRRMAQDLIREAKAILKIFGDKADTLRQLADFIIARRS